MPGYSIIPETQLFLLVASKGMTVAERNNIITVNRMTETKIVLRGVMLTPSGGCR